jgi:hypothetical protein
MSETGRLTERQRRGIPFLLASPSTEEACRRAKINKTTVYEWLKGETFGRSVNASARLSQLAIDYYSLTGPARALLPH